jgi:biotin carboxylase
MRVHVLLLRYSPYWSEAVLSRASRVSLVVERKDAAELPSDVRERVHRVYVVESFDSITAVTGLAAQVRSDDGPAPERVASATEHTQYAAGLLAALLDLPRAALAVAHLTRNKVAMKAALKAAGVPVAPSVALALGRPLDVAALEAALGYPVVLKPGAGYGTINTFTLRDRDALERSWQELQLQNHGPCVDDHWLVESQVTGDELHVDAVWRDGEPWAFHVSRYFDPVLRMWEDGGLDGSVLLPEREHGALYAQLLSLQTDVNAALGVENGATHLEVFQTAEGDLVVGEIASRLGGAAMTEVIAEQSGLDLRDVWALELLDGKPQMLEGCPGRFSYYGWLNLKPQRSGSVVAIASEAELLSCPNVLRAHVYFRPGMWLDLAHPSVWCSLVVLGAQSEAALRQVALTLLANHPTVVA